MLPRRESTQRIPTTAMPLHVKTREVWVERLWRVARISVNAVCKSICLVGSFRLFFQFLVVPSITRIHIHLFTSYSSLLHGSATVFFV
jgi:transcriptional regulator of nitric oxide reductase